MIRCSYILGRVAGALLLTITTDVAFAQATQNTTYSYQYDAIGNRTQITDPLGNITNQSYDALNRLVQQQQPAPTSTAARPVVSYSYDGLDQLASVTDPRNLITSYSIDGLGNKTALTSPDTGTSTRTYDDAGNVLTSIDANGQTTSYQYDVLNRIASISYAGGNITNYQYDQGPNALGRLTQISDAGSTIQYGYDQKGRVIGETRVVGTVSYVTSYGYDNASHLISITYPSGRLISYTRDSLGRISQIDTSGGGISQTLVKQVTYQPFGGVRSFINGANQTVARSFDLDGRTASMTLGSSTQLLGYDAASRISFISDAINPANTQTYAYDNLDRLIQYSGSGGSQSINYDAVGNRISQVVGTAITSYSYGNTSNRLTQLSGGQNLAYAIDPNGSITNNGANQFAYDGRGRMTTANTAAGPVQYQLNALGQRIMKSTPTATTVFQYDISGKLIGESSATGAVQTEYVYLNDMPVAVLK